MALTHSQLQAITNDFVVPEVVDNVYNGVPFLHRLTKNNRKMISAADQIRVPIIFQQTGQAGGFDGTGPLPTTMNDVITAADFDWVTYQAPVVFSRREEAQNRGKEGIVKLVDTLKQNASLDAMNSVGGDTIIGNDTASSTQELDGLELMVDDDDTPKAYGGILTTDFSGWKADDDATVTATSLLDFQQAIGAVTFGADRPSLILCTQKIFDKTWSLLQANERYQDVDEASAGFMNLLISGIPMLVDRNVPAASGTSHTYYVLNEKYITLYVHSDYDFAPRPFQEAEDQWSAISHLIWMGQLTSNNRRMHARRTARDPS